MKETESNFQKGFSMLELLIVISIVLIIAVMAMTQFGRTETRLQRQNIARELKVYLERARFDSVKRRATTRAAMARVVITSGTAFNVTTDMNLNGTIDTADTRFMSLNGRTDARITGTTFPITILFDHRGQATAVSSADGTGPDIPMPTFTICDAGCTPATANANNSTAITVTPTGTVAMMNGGQTIANVNTPNVTTLSGNNGISNLVYVNSNN